MTQLIAQDAQQLYNLLFCVLGTFRYSAVHFPLDSCRASTSGRECDWRTASWPIFRPFTRGLLPSKKNSIPSVTLTVGSTLHGTTQVSGDTEPGVGIAGLAELVRFQNEDAASEGARSFDLFLRDFMTTVPENGFFSGNARAYTHEILSKNVTPGVLVLYRTEPGCRVDLLLDSLYSSPVDLSEVSSNNLSESAISSPRMSAPAKSKNSSILLRDPGKYQIVGRHRCCKYNVITQQHKYVLIHLVTSIVRHCKAIRNYLECIEYNVEAVLRPENRLIPPIQQELHRFFSRISEFPIHYNLVFIVDNADRLDQSFYLILKECQAVMPKYLKLVLTMTKDSAGSHNVRILSGTHGLFVSHGNYLPQLCAYMKGLTIPRGDEGEDMAKQIHTYAADSSIDKFRALWKDLRKGDAVDRTKLSDLCSVPRSFGRDKTLAKVLEIAKQVAAYKCQGVLENIIILLLEVRSPVPLCLLEEWLGLPETPIVQDAVRDFKHVFRFRGEITGDTMVRLKHRAVWAEVWKDKRDEKANSLVSDLCDKCWTAIDTESSAADLKEYYRLNAVFHYTRIVKPDMASVGIRFVHPEWMFSQVSHFKSFDVVLSELESIAAARKDQDLVRLRNQILLVEQACADCEIVLSDFVAQLRGRLLNDESLLFQSFVSKLNDFSCPYFRAMFPSLKENNNVTYVAKNEGEVVAALLEDNVLVWGTSLGIIAAVYIPELRPMGKAFVEPGIAGMCYAGEGKVLLASEKGALYLWPILDHVGPAPEASVEAHEDGAIFVAAQDKVFFSAGKDQTICRGTISPLAVDARSVKLERPITAFLIAKNSRGETTRSTLVFAGQANGIVKIFNSDLHWLVNVQHGEERIVSLQVSAQKEYVMSVSSDGAIKVLDLNYYTCISDLSIFDVTESDLISALFAEGSGLLVGVEGRTMRFYKMYSCTLIDTWTHVFSAGIRVACKSADDKFLLIGDKDGHLCVYNIHKSIEQRASLGVPSHRPDCVINHLVYTTNLPGDQRIMSCSGEREIKIWGRDNGKFIKKYSLASIACIAALHITHVADVITSAELDRETQNIVYLGCKDTNIYQIDLNMGLAAEPFADQHGMVWGATHEFASKSDVLEVAGKCVWDTHLRVGEEHQGLEHATSHGGF